MTRSKAVNTANLKPFKKGDDSRRHKGGRKSKEAIQLSTALLNALTDEGKKDEKFKKLAEKIWAQAILGKPWAVEIILERFLGKVTQPLEHGGKIEHDMNFNFGDNGE